MTHLHIPSRRATLLTAAASLAVITAPAATLTWDGGDSLWQTPATWVGDVAPVAGDALIFAGTVDLASQNDFPAGTAFLGLTFSAGAGAFNITGNGIVLNRTNAGTGTALTGGNITNNATTAQTVGLPVTLSPGNHSIATGTGAGTLNLTGTFARSTGSTLVFTKAGGDIHVTGSGLANNAAGILGGWALIGDAWASLDGSGNVVPYSGYTGITAGAIPLASANLNYRHTGTTTPLTAANGTTLNSFTFNSGAATTLTVSGTMKLGSRGGIARTSTSTGVHIVNGGIITANGGGEITLVDAPLAATGNNLRIDSVISNDGPNVVSVNVVGYLDIRGANTYTGGTFINQGRIQAGPVTTFGTGPVTIYPGGSTFLNVAGGNWASNFFVAGVGSTEQGTDNPAGPGAIRLGNTSNITGSITLQGNTRLTSSSSTSTGPVISGRITGTGTLELVPFANSSAILNLSNTNLATPNNWSGPLVINTISPARALTVRLGADEQVPDASDLTLTGGTSLTSANIATFNLNGSDETIGGLNSSAAYHVVTNLAAAGLNSILTVGTGNANGDYAGKFQDVLGGGTLSLVKNGSGKQVLRGFTAYGGTTTVNGGILEMVGDIIADGLVTVNSGATFASNGAVTGNVIVADGGQLYATGTDGSDMALSGSLDLGTGTTLTLSTASLPALTVAGALTPTGAAGSVTVNLDTGDSLPTVGLHPLITYGSLAGSGVGAFALGTLPARFAATLVNDAPNNTIALNVTASDFPVWSGALGSEWSTSVLSSPKNWVLSSNGATATDFISGESVVFNNNAIGTTVDVSGANVQAARVHFNHTTKNYLLTGSHAISSTSELLKEGTGVLTIASEGHSFADGIRIEAGTLRVGNGGTTGNLGANAVKNNAVLEFNRSDSPTMANVISGPGEVKQVGSGVVTLSAANTYDGETTVASGTLRITNNASLGTGPVTVEAGGALNISGNPTVNGQNFGSKQFFISGNGPSGLGALVNIGGAGQNNAYQSVTLEADASVGGDTRFDIRNGSAKLALDGHTLRKRGTNQVTVVSGIIEGDVDGDPMVPSKVIVEEGTFAVEVSTRTEPPVSGGSFIVEPNAHFQFFQNTIVGVDGGITWPITLRENSATGNAGATLATVPANIILEGNAVLVPFTSGTRNPANNFPITFTGTITENLGSFGFAKEGVNTVTLSGTGSNYTGATLVNAGTLSVTGSIPASPVTVAAGATLNGTGTLGGTVTNNGTISPGVGGGGFGTLATGSTNLGATATLVFETNSTSLASDKLVVTGNLNLGGLLNVTDLGATLLPAGSRVVIASYTGTLTGAFSNAPDNGTVVVGLNTFTVDYNEDVSGTLSVTLTVPTDSAYDEWATDMDLDGTNSGKLQDPDNDGLDNIVEFGLDGDPLSGAANGKTRLAIADVDPGAPVENAITLTLPVRTDADFDGPGDLVSAAIDDIIYKIQGSLSLGDFTSLDVTEVSPALAADMPGLTPGWSYRTFRLPGTPGNPHAKAFLRADVSEAP
ncbi:autotransporter-associated beta strand repeat-containing protein [Luteolibacter arcticus]|uniref:Autotransporter-associated beta strand repeat-containing protein n=1 Tax=Luteolibacter arcticus TaxID=1581411 RepID=A0ABT3GMD3_9BACT|nr:autotransporter-associated beta strand repeat-containing protein [Luteolibacter arcticus]MCW1924685.1 autotransporter-associated beta strand repeat-containing protein [Luteolibacter arcticus]